MRDFADPAQPGIEKIHAAGLLPEGMSLCVTDTRGSHSELTGEFAAIRNEMEAVASQLGGRVLGQVREADFWAALPRLRTACGDRAVLRAAHYFEENARALVQRDALRAGDFPVFLKAIAASGHASYTLCQNVYCSTDVRHQGLSVALALSQTLLEHSGGAWRMQGGGFAGTIQAFVPQLAGADRTTTPWKASSAKAAATSPACGSREQSASSETCAKEVLCCPEQRSTLLFGIENGHVQHG